MVNRAVRGHGAARYGLVVVLVATLARSCLAHVSRPVVGASSRRSPVGATRRSVATAKATALVRRDDGGDAVASRRSVLATSVLAWSVAARGSTAAETGGRLGGGGSFPRDEPRARPRDRVRRPTTTTRLEASSASSASSPAGTALVVGTFVAVVAHGGASGPYSRSEKSAEVTRTSIALDVADRDAPDSVLSVLRRLSETASTDTLEGVRTLVSKVSLELLRRRRSIFAAVSRRERFDDFGRAERTFHEWSVRERAKFQRETVSVYDGIDDSVRLNDDDDDVVVRSGKATSVVVTLTTAATTTTDERRRRRGDDDESLVVGGVRSIEDVERVLTTLSSSSSSLLSAEILWTPAERTETLARDDVWRDHPDLVALA